ncbi:hypothetical protein [Phreatobacter sp.]|uniref:hypothetical protein n=1 Tax=Phreatobacter sp. TaxID=1966341 RepID=UPI003F729F5E
MHRVSKFLLGLLACVGLLLSSASSRAEFRGADHLAGWWLSVDTVAFPPLWDAGMILAMEELLIIDGQGRFQSRMMMFTTPEASQCRDGSLCSDAQMLVQGSVAVSGGALTFSGLTSTSLTADGAETDRDIRARILPARARWQVEGEATAGTGIMRLRSEAGAAPRIFVKVDPDVLRRVRSGFTAQIISPAQHWRCYLGRVAGDPATTGRLDPDPAVRAYLRAASLAQTIASLRAPPATGQDASRGGTQARAPEHLMVEAHPALPAPATAVERRRLDIMSVILEQVRQGRTWEAATDMVRRAARPADIAIPLDEEARAAWQAVGQDAGLYERLFCHRP